MIKSSVTLMMLSYIDDVEQLTGLVAGRLFSEGGDGYMSIKKIAEKAGVSPATVSRVLNNPNYKCSVSGLRDKIWKTAIEMNYVPNEAARNLKRGVSAKQEKTWYINILMTRTDSSTTDPFFAELLRVIESEIHDKNCILSKVWYMSVFSDDRKCRRENLDRLIKFERGFVLTVTGVPGSGKSEFVDEIAMRLLLRHDWKVGYFSPENTPLAYHYRKLIRRVVGKRFEHKGMPLPEAGQAIRYLAQSVFSIMPKEDFSVESVLRIAAQLVSRKGVKVLVVDPFNRFEHQIPDWETETQYISRIFDEFSNFAVKHKVLLILVAHPTKLRREPGSKRWPVPTLYDINGSAAFFNKTDYGMVVDRNDELGQVLVRVAKVRFDHLGGPGDAFFAFSTYNGRYTPTEERTLDHNPPEPKWEHTNFLTEKLKPEQQGLGFNEG